MASQKVNLTGMYLFVFPLVLLVVVGGLSNLYTASGLTPPGTTFTLTCNNQTSICSDPNSVGCAITTSPYNDSCTLQNNNAIGDILNPNSPFTYLLGGNIFGFFTSLSSSASSGTTTYNGDVPNPTFGQGPFDALGGGSYYTGICTVYPLASGRTGLMDYNITGCTQTIPAQNTNVTASQAANETNFNQVGADATYNLALYQVYNFQKVTPQYSNYPEYPDEIAEVGCTWQGTYNFTTTGSGVNATSTGYTWYGCGVTLDGWISPPGAPVWQFMIAIDNSIGHISNGYNQVAVFIQPEQWNVNNCLLYYSDPSSYPGNASQQCLTFETNVNPVASVNTSGFGALTLVIAWVAGIILFIGGLGINLYAGGSILGSGTSAGVGINPQGTRLMQVMGIGLIIWIPIYSEFSSWINSTIFPNGLNIVVEFLMLAIPFIGLFVLMLTNSSTNP